MKYHVWSEGYQASGDSATASYMGCVEANSWDEAVQKLVPSAKKQNGKWYDWRCQLFDNEIDARELFG